jgi:hypothetical protein
MVLGIVGLLGGWCLLGIPCVLAIFMGHFAIRECRTEGKQGEGMAVTGLVLGYVCVLPAAIFSIMALMGSASQ